MKISFAGARLADPPEVFQPFVGQMAWLLQRGIGSFLTLEFGNPHLLIGEPKVPRRSRPAPVKRDLRRRKVYVTGDWHFWIQCEWRISTQTGTLTSDHRPGIRWDECLQDLNGQTLLSVTKAKRRHSLRFKFDLGGELEMWPTPGLDDLHWSLHGWNGEIVGFRKTLTYQKFKPKHRW
jgi:hypothetical protein